MATKKYKKGAVVVKATKMQEIKDKQGNLRKAMVDFNVSANGFSSVQWYGVKIVGGEDYYIKKAVELGAEVGK